MREDVQKAAAFAMGDREAAVFLFKKVNNILYCVKAVK